MKEYSPAEILDGLYKLLVIFNSSVALDLGITDAEAYSRARLDDAGRILRLMVTLQEEKGLVAGDVVIDVTAALMLLLDAHRGIIH